MKLLSAIDRGIMKLFSFVMAYANAAICIMILAGAFLRYVLKKDFYGQEELVLLVAFWMYFVGSAVATRKDTQVSADLVTSMLKSEKAIAILVFIRTVITAFLFGVLAKWAIDYLAWSVQMRPTTAVYKIPMYFVHASLVVSFVLSVLYQIRHVCHAAAELGRAFGKVEEGEQK